jgi:hypothetical protein
MKWFVLIVGIAFAVGCQRQPQPRSPAPMDQHANSLAADHPAEHGSHSVHSESAPTLAFVKDAGWDKLAPTVSTPLTFHLEQAGKPVKSLELLHEKLMHLIVVRNDLGEFQHLHPVVSDDGHASIDLQLPTAGHYWIYLDAQPRGGAQQTARNELHLAGDAPAAAELAVNVPGKVSAGELSTEISLTKAGSEWMITFTHTDSSGRPITDLEPYLGAMGHLVVVGAKTGEYVHANPETESAPDGVVRFAAHFNRAGTYKLWGQFLRHGQVFTVPAVLEIQ